MIAAALQVVPQTWPSILHPHPWAVAASVLVGAVLFAYAAGHRESGGASKTQTTRDVSGKMFQADVLNYHEAPSDSSLSNKTPLVSLPVEVRSKPNLQSLGVRDIVDEAFGDGSVFVLRIENALKDIPIDKAYSVCANLKLRNRYGQTETVESAYWKGHFSNQITIDKGAIEAVVLGRWANYTWHFYNNPRRNKPSDAALRAGGFEYPMEPGEIDLDNGDVYLDVKIFSRPQGIVLLEDHYRIDSKFSFLQRILLS